MASLALMLGAACAGEHPTSERTPMCSPGRRCPVADHACIDTLTLGLRCMPTCTFPSDCLPDELCAYISDTGGRVCFPPGPAPLGAACSHVEECASGALCPVGPLDYGYALPFHESPVCIARCDQRTDAGSMSCPTGSVCTRLSQAGADHACVVPCDPETGAGCAADELCLSYVRCVPLSFGTQYDCALAPCMTGQLCDLDARECVTPAEYARRHPTYPP